MHTNPYLRLIMYINMPKCLFLASYYHYTFVTLIKFNLKKEKDENTY